MTYWIILTSMRCLNFQKLSEQTHANTMRSLQIIHLGSMSTYIPPWSGGNGWKSRSGHSDILYCTRVLFQIHPSRRSQILGSSLLRWSKQRCVLSFFPSFMRSIACAWWLGSLPHGVFFSIPCAKKKTCPKEMLPAASKNQGSTKSSPTYLKMIWPHAPHACLGQLSGEAAGDPWLGIWST